MKFRYSDTDAIKRIQIQIKMPEMLAYKHGQVAHKNLMSCNLLKEAQTAQ